MPIVKKGLKFEVNDSGICTLSYGDPKQSTYKGKPTFSFGVSFEGKTGTFANVNADEAYLNLTADAYATLNACGRVAQGFRFLVRKDSMETKEHGISSVFNFWIKDPNDKWVKLERVRYSEGSGDVNQANSANKLKDKPHPRKLMSWADHLIRCGNEAKSVMSACGAGDMDGDYVGAWERIAVHISMTQMREYELFLETPEPASKEEPQDDLPFDEPDYPSQAEQDSDLPF